MTLTWGYEPMEAEADIQDVLDDGIHECDIRPACVEWMIYIRISDRGACIQGWGNQVNTCG